jgi:hypothetical protein
MQPNQRKNTTFLIELEKRTLNYLGGLAKNRKIPKKSGYR